MTRWASALNVPHFPRLLVSYTVNELGDSIGVLALALLVYDRTGEPLAMTALFLAARFGPAFVAPALTARLDQLVRHRTLAALYAAEAVAFCALAALSTAFWLPLVLILAFIDGTLALTGRGLTRGAQAAVLEPAGQLREGNALTNVGLSVAGVGGALLGGLLVTQAGFAAALLIDAGSFLAISMLLALGPPLPKSAGAERVGWMARLLEGIRHVRREHVLVGLLVFEGLAFILFTLVLPVEVVYARETLHADGLGYGLLLASWAVGMVCGSAVFLVAGSRVGLVALAGWATVVVGLGYLGMSLVGTVEAACLLSFVGGIGNGVQWVSVVTALQERTPPDLQARVAGLLESVAAAAPGLGFLLGGGLAAAFSPTTAFAVAGIGLLVLTAAAAVARGRYRAIVVRRLA